jgi:hypothetical protein
VDYASGLVMLEGEDKMAEATRLYQQALSTKPRDALESLGVALAREELQN